MGQPAASGPRRSGSGVAAAEVPEDLRGRPARAAPPRAPHPAACAASTGPLASPSTTLEPSGRPTRPRRCTMRPPPWHGPPAAPCSRPPAAPERRSAVTATRVGASSSGASRARTSASSAGTGSRAPPAPPPAGSPCVGSTSVISPSSPRRLSPARASTAPASPCSRVFAQPRLHVAAQADDLQVRPPRAQDADTAAQRGGPHPRALRQLVQRQPRGAAEGIARILARGHRREQQPRRAAPTSCP